MPEKYSNIRTNIVAASDNTRNDAKKLAELSYQSRKRTLDLWRKEVSEKRAEEAVKEREARKKDPGYDEKKERARVAKIVAENDDGKYTSKKNTFIGRFADNMYHNSGANYYVNRAKELAKEGANPFTQLANTGLGVIGTTFNSAIGGVDAVGNLVSPKSNFGTSVMGLIAETPVGGIPITLVNAGRQLGGATGETGAEVLATVIPGMRRPTFQPRPVRLAPGQRGVPTIRIEGNGTPRYDWAMPNPNRSTWTTLGANIFEPMSRAEIAEAIQNGTMRYADLNGNVLGTWRNIAHNGGVHILMRRNPNGGYFLPENQPVIGYLPNGLRVTMDPIIAGEYINGTRRYPSLLNESEVLNFGNIMRGTVEFDGYGIEGPRYRVTNENGSVVHYYPEVANIILRRPSANSVQSTPNLEVNRILSRPPLDDVLQGLTDPDEILAAKWGYLEKYASNPELVRSIRRTVESGRDTSPILSTLSNKQIDYLVDLGMLNKPRHTGNMVGMYNEAGDARPYTPRDVIRSLDQDWARRVHGSVFDFTGATNSYSYQSYLAGLKYILKKIENGEARILKPGNRTIRPNDYASILFILPETGEVISYPRTVGNYTYGSGYGRAGGAMNLDVLNRLYRLAFEKYNALGRKLYGNLWTDVIWEDITPDQIMRQYEDFEVTRKHPDVRILGYKYGGKPQLYDRRLISKIKGI